MYMGFFGAGNALTQNDNMFVISTEGSETTEAERSLIIDIFIRLRCLHSKHYVFSSRHDILFVILADICHLDRSGEISYNYPYGRDVFAPVHLRSLPVDMTIIILCFVKST